MKDQEVQLYKNMLQADHELSIVRENRFSNNCNAVSNLLSQECGNGLTVGGAVASWVDSFSYCRKRLVDLEIALAAFSKQQEAKLMTYNAQKEFLETQLKVLEEQLEVLKELRMQIDFKDKDQVKNYFYLLEKLNETKHELQFQYDRIFG